MPGNETAKSLIALHGRRAPQHLVDRIAAALRRGDDAETGRLDLLLQEVDRLQRNRA